ncbi:MAG TPA: MGMT family protein [Anaerolineaceae bacterium]|jgi:methylated-DNA-protein-cysteine methyltransferase-like protein
MDAQIPAPPSWPEFDETVWEIVRQIPAGRVATYGKIAALIPAPAGVDPAEFQAWRARWVGTAMSASPQGVPWQRVINAQGKISPRGPGAARQRELLEAEGVVFDERERVDLARFGWEGPNPAQSGGAADPAPRLF